MKSRQRQCQTDDAHIQNKNPCGWLFFSPKNALKIVCCGYTLCRCHFKWQNFALRFRFFWDREKECAIKKTSEKKQHERRKNSNQKKVPKKERKCMPQQSNTKSTTVNRYRNHFKQMRREEKYVRLVWFGSVKKIFGPKLNVQT